MLDTSSEEPQRAGVHNRLGKSQEPMPGSSNDQLLCARCHAVLHGSGEETEDPNTSRRIHSQMKGQKLDYLFSSIL